jgi:hypothetical protein
MLRIRATSLLLLSLPSLCIADFGDPAGAPAELWQADDGTPVPAEVTLAAGRDGSSIAAWVQDEYGFEQLMFQRFAVDGMPIAPAQAMDDFASPKQTYRRLVATIDAAGVATVAFEAQGDADFGAGVDIGAMRVDAEGRQLGAAFRVNSSVAGEQARPAIDADRLGHVLITWSGEVDGGFGVFGQLYNAGGFPQSPETRIDETPASAPVDTLALLGDCCEVVVAWAARTDSAHELRARSFSLGWTPWVAETALASRPLELGAMRVAAEFDVQQRLRVAWLDAGGQVWHQQFDGVLQPLTNVASLAPQWPADPASALEIGVGHDGQFMLAWTREDGPLSQNVLAHFDGDGQLVQERSVLDSDPAAPNFRHRMRAFALDLDGDPVLLWQRSDDWSPTMSLHAGRFGGWPNTLLTPLEDHTAEIVAAGSTFTYRPVVWNLAAATNQPEVGRATGVAFRIQLDPAFSLLAFDAAAGWNCVAPSDVICVSPQMDAGTTIAPVQLVLQVAKSATGALHNGLRVDQLETSTMPWMQQQTQTITVGDGEPDAVVFPTRTGVPRHVLVESDAVVVRGFNLPIEVEARNGSLSVNGGDWSAVQTVVEGDVLRVRHYTATGFGESSTSTVSIGTQQASFTSITAPIDATPDGFVFVDQSGLATGTQATSAPIIVTGINAASPISIGGGLYRINGGAATAAPGSVQAGDSVVVLVSTSEFANAPVSAIVTIGGVSDSFTARTGSIDSTPTLFTFADVVDARRGRMITSNRITVGGINTPVPISVSGNQLRYSKNGGPFTATPGSVVVGDQIRVQMASSSAPYTTVSGMVNIGGRGDLWTVSTGAL